MGVRPEDTVESLKAAVAALSGVSAASQYVVFAGKALDDEKSLAAYNVQSESCVYMTACLCGGAKKRKKKIYTTPKKIKKKHLNMRLAVLRYYKVAADGAVSNTRRECPSCGPSNFMALHRDRHHCGKCGLLALISEDSKEFQLAIAAAEENKRLRAAAASAGAPAAAAGSKGKK